MCINNGIKTITYSVGGGATGVELTGSLPEGILQNYDSDNRIFTISGTATSAGIFDYTITTTGSCENNSINGKITIQDNSTIGLSSGENTTNFNVCINGEINSITYSVGGGATGANISAGTLPTRSYWKIREWKFYNSGNTNSCRNF
ncbi:hypothetical protein LZ575_20785 [Antarcticibacterium sp. 1MA-6-2]|uniref:hypothetical protein n=1 Tax=Antarcticibacterium sp. 1MA-6-2 TaxID=2908210 RepID=UPI001F2285FB|nr:hypothetical protein [Antarcticibacterium sp. 1MA-6-2]UJH91066.1 hypothetical protein LZ575_20785 [Antarcticibacterium sp. 1MA-6-2]